MSFLSANRYYYCERTTPLSNFTCYEYNSFMEADSHPKDGVQTTILYYPAFTPRLLDRFRLRYDLSRFCKVTIIKKNEN